MAQYTYHEQVKFTLTNPQKSALATFLATVTNLPTADMQSIRIERGSAPGEVLMYVNGQRVRNCTTQAQAEALLDEVLAGTVQQVTQKA